MDTWSDLIHDIAESHLGASWDGFEKWLVENPGLEYQDYVDELAETFRAKAHDRMMYLIRHEQ